jgi:N-acetylglucosamine-6-phosphate deacetylase
MRRLITARSLVVHNADGSALLDHPAVLIEDGAIASITRRDAASLPAHDAHDDDPDATLCPAFLDIHIHGAMGQDVMTGTPAALETVGRFLATRGVGAYLPTTVTAPIDTTLHALSGIAKFIGSGSTEGATPLGIHLEGPFISHAKRGVHPPEKIQKPSVELFTRFWEAAEGNIRLMTVAPEIEGAIELIEHATRLGVRVSLGHSNADTAEAERGIAAGGRSATHTYNAMRALDHRDPGLLGTVLDTDTLYAELICDGIHVHPALVRLFWKAKGRDRAILITDGMSATGMPEGEYQLGGMTITVKDGRCTLVGSNGDGVLAGSVLTLDRAVRNFRAFTSASLADTIALVTTNPAALTGVANAHGAVAHGCPADITVLATSGDVAAVYLRGRLIA